MDKNIKHTVFIEYGQGLIATAVGEVLYFNEREIKLKLLSGERLLVMGEKLKINGFDKNCGELKLLGAIISVRYVAPTSSKFKKLFG